MPGVLWWRLVWGPAQVVTLLGLGVGCSGKLSDNSDKTEGTPTPGVTAGGAAANSDADPPSPEQLEQARADGIAALDEALQAEDPELFSFAEQYFPSDDPSAMPKRLARLSRKQIDLTTQHLLPTYYSDAAEAALPPDPLVTNYEYAENLSVNQSNFTPLTDWIDAIAERVRLDPSGIVNCAETDSACLDAAARTFVSSAFRGVVADADLARFSDFFRSQAATLGIAEAAADLVRVTLSSPGYLYRDEVMTDSASDQLLPAQRLQSISYTLSDSPPARVGLSSDTPSSDTQASIRAVLATDEARDKLLRFFISWLEIKDSDSFNIDPDVFPEFTPAVAAAAVQETHAFLQHQLSSAAPSLKSVTQSSEAFVSEALEFIYGTAAADGALVSLDANQRLGIFTQPALIASHSGPTTTRLVKRGVFFTRKVMCLELGTPPEGVDTSLPELDGASERQRVESVTTPAQCMGCHAFINPFGYIQENYDPIGRFRTTDESGLEINSSISVDFLDEGPLTTSSPVEALRGFTNSMRFQQCFARQLFRFYLGRSETSGDDPLLRQAFFQFAVNQQQDIVGLLSALAGSPQFTQRSDTQEVQ